MRTSPGVKLMVALCATVLLAATFPESPVADAARDGDVDAVRALLQRGVDVNTAHGDGMTALHWAADRGDAEIAEMLVYAGANVHAVTRIGEYTRLHVATTTGKASVVDREVEAVEYSWQLLHLSRPFRHLVGGAPWRSVRPFSSQEQFWLVPGFTPRCDA